MQVTSKYSCGLGGGGVTSGQLEAFQNWNLLIIRVIYKEAQRVKTQNE